MAYSNITLTTQTGLSFITGEFIQLIHDSNNYMFGQIVSYNPSTGSLTFTPTRVVGTGTYSTWEVIASGAAGNDGTSGTSGINGTSGTSGATGTSGASGTSGTSGTDGTSGSSGIDGTSGTSGLTGTSGTSGVNGTSGVSGTSGTSGTDGATGSSGTAGTSGTSGVDGTSGTSGTSGINGTSGITPDPNARTETTFTATAGQTTFTVSYTVGQVDVYYNGSKLAPAEFTATTGTDIVLATACQAGDIVDVLANITGGGVGGGGSAGNVAYFSSTNVIAGSNNLAWDNSSQYFTIGAPPTALANLHVYNPSAAASMLLQTNSSTDYGEIAVRNNASTATSYFRQYSTAATGSDFGISRAGLALFFSNYATNFAIGTRNGGDLILGTADTERARILASNGYVGINTSSPSYLLDVNGTGRFTGALTGASATFSGTLSTNAGFGILSGGGGYAVGPSATRGVIAINGSGDQLLTFSTQSYIYNSSSLFRMLSSSDIDFVAGGTQRLLISASTGAATFSGNVRIDKATPLLVLNDTSGSGAQIGSFSNNLNLIDNATGTKGLVISLSTGAATFSSSVTATAFIPSYSTSYFGADGTISNYSATNYMYVNGTGGLRLKAEGVGYQKIVLEGGTSNDIWFTTANTERMRITSGGIVLINSSTTPNGNHIMYVNGSNLVMGVNASNGGTAENMRFYNAGTPVGTITTTGSSTAYNTSSDYRLKQDLKNYNGLSLVSAIKTYDFEWKADNSRMYGVLAHELQEVIPYAVFGKKDALEKDGSIKAQGVDYSKLVPILVKAIQEQQKQIEELKALINK